MAALLLLSAGCEVRREKSPEEDADVPVVPSVARRVRVQYENLQQDTRTGAALQFSADDQALYLRVENIHSAMKRGKRYVLFFALRGPAVLSGPDAPPEPTGFRWNLITDNPLPDDQLNANPNTVIALPLTLHKASSAVRAYSVDAATRNWRPGDPDAQATPVYNGNHVELSLPWRTLATSTDGRTDELWADVLVILYDEDASEIAAVFPVENGIGPRVLLSYALSFQRAAAEEAGGRWVNSAATDFSMVLTDGPFGHLDERWREIRFPDAGSVEGRAQAARGVLALRAHGAAAYGLYYTNRIDGTFDVQLEGHIAEGTACGLALFKDVGGQPDPDSGVRIERTKDAQGNKVVRAYALRSGESMAKEWHEKTRPFFEYQLGCDEFGHEAIGFRVLRDERASCLRLYYKHRRRVDGVDLDGWVEFPTVADWDKRGWFVCPYVRSKADVRTTARFGRLLIANTRRDDSREESAGFGAHRRTYTFSGVSGEGLVITFGQEFPFHRTARFVFWSEANYMPWWHIDDKCAVSYQSAETWEGGTTWKGTTPGGCCEPMSDRLGRWSRVSVLETNDARVVVSWRYVLVNPEYQWWGLDPVKRPLVEERFCFYPDGVGVRTVTYHPVTGTRYGTQWNEIAEFLVVQRGGVMPSECLNRTALSMGNLREGMSQDYTYLTKPPQYVDKKTKHWDEVLIRANLNDRPSPFMVVAQGAASFRKTFPAPYDTWWGHYDNSWHVERMDGYEYEDDFWPFSHWPISRIPYEDHTKTHSRYIREPGHTSVISLPGHPGPTGPTTWSMLIGLGSHGENEGLRRKASSWLYPGEVSVTADGFRFIENDYYHRALVFERTGPGDTCRFTLEPRPVCVNPVLSIRKWGGSRPAVLLNGKPLSAERYRHAVVDNDLVLWVSATLWSNTTFSIESSPLR